MSDAHSEAQEHPKRETLWVTDAELIRRIGAPEKIAYEAIRALDQNRHSGFPQKQKLWGGRRYWPAVVAYFDATNGLRVGPSADRLIPENRPAPASASSPYLRSAPRRSQ